MDLSLRLIEVSAWRFICELCRRYPDRFAIIETHPSGGLSDCITLWDKEHGIMAGLNRSGHFHILKSYRRPKEGSPHETEKIVR